MISIPDPLITHVLNNLHLLLNRDFLLDLFTGTEKTLGTLTDPDHAVVAQETIVYQGKLLSVDNLLYAVTAFDGIGRSHGEPLPVVSLNTPVMEQFAQRNSIVILPGNVVANYQATEPLTTTLGRLLLNQTILAVPFGDMIGYINTQWNIGKIEEEIFAGLQSGKISVDQVKTYSRNIHFIGHFTELALPSFSEKSLTIDPAIIKRRDELLKQYAPQLALGDEAVMAQIESILIEMYKTSIKNDPSALYYDSNAKSYDVHQKTMYIMGGMVPGFGDKAYSFVKTSLEEGWQVKDFPIICNEIRRGSYNRAKETAKGGEESKFLIRVLQNTRVTEEDCGSEQYLNVQLSKDMIGEYLYRNILIDGKLLMLTAANMPTYIGTTVKMRSPMYCHTPSGYCFTCMGELFRSISQEQLTMSSLAVTSSFLRASLKSIHTSRAKKIEIKSLNQFVV